MRIIFRRLAIRHNARDIRLPTPYPYLDYSLKFSTNSDSEYSIGVQCFFKAAKTNSADAHSTLLKAISHWTSAAEKGHVKALSALGNFYLKGHVSVTKNKQLAKTYLQKAADMGHSESCFQLASLLHSSPDVTSCLSPMVHYYEKAASLGHKRAQYNLGLLYLQGSHVPKDPARAFHYFQNASRSGLLDAQDALGSAYLYGHGIARDIQKAVAHYRHAANSGHAMAQFHLAMCQFLGLGTEMDRTQAAELYFLSAEARIAPAQYCLAQCLEYGWGLPRDVMKANEYYALAGHDGKLAALTVLKQLSGLVGI